MFDLQGARIVAEKAPKLTGHKNREAYILPALYLKKACDEIEQLQDESERLRIQLAGCGVAANANTPKHRADRLKKDSPYWSASYGDVCRAVDREIALREKVEELQKTKDI